MFDALYQFHSLLMVSWAEKRPVEGGISHAIVRIYHLEYSHLKMIALINCLPSRNSTKPFTGSTPALFTYHCHCWKEEEKVTQVDPQTVSPTHFSSEAGNLSSQKEDFFANLRWRWITWALSAQHRDPVSGRWPKFLSGQRCLRWSPGAADQ